MSWSSWSAKLNVQSIVSQGLEQVSKLREDVEKQFDQVVAASSTQPPGSSSRTSAATAAVQAEIEPPSAAVSAALFGEPLLNGKSAIAAAPPPRSLDSKGSTALLASLGIAKASPADPPASAPSSSTSKRAPTADDFFGSFLSEEAASPPKVRAAAPAAPADSKAGSSLLIEVEHGLSIPSDDSVNDDLAEKGDTVATSAEDGQDALPLDKSPDDETSSDPCATIASAKPDLLSISGEAQTNENGTAEVEVCEETEFDCEHVSTTAASNERGINDYVNEAPEVVFVEAGSSPLVEDQQSLGHSQSTDTNTEEPIQSNGVRDTDFSSLKDQLAQREAQLMSTSALIQELHDELDKTCQREVVAVEKNRFLTEQLDLLRSEVLRLNRVVSQHQQQPSRELELLALQQAVADKDTKLQALLDEGQALSVKQSQLEQRLRQLRRERNEEEEQKLKLQAQSDTLAIQLQELTQKQNDWEDEKKLLQSDLKAAQVLAEQSNHELSGRKGELQQLQEANWCLTRDISEMKTENTSLKAEIERLTHTSVSHATLSVENGELEATIQYLQQTVQDLQGESSRREDLARIEISDLKRKWKEALHRVEVLGQSVPEATQPLLRQIHALQEDQRARQETWQATEKTLLQRIHDACAQRNTLEADKIAASQELHVLRCRAEDLQIELKRKESDALREKERIEVTQEREREARSKYEALQIELEELKLKLQEEQHAKQSLLARVAVAATETKTKSVEQGDGHTESATLIAEVEQMRQREEQLRHDLEWHQKELQRLKSASSSPRVGILQQRRSFDEDWNGSGNGSPRVSGQNPSQASILQRTLESSSDDSRLSSTSVLGLSQLQQRLRLREGENRLLRQQLQAIEDKQKQTTDEIVRLSTRNALLESSAAQFQQTQQELEHLKQKQHVLLELFGEKEEQVEELQSEVKELKAFYKKQLDTLAGQHK